MICAITLLTLPAAITAHAQNAVSMVTSLPPSDSSFYHTSTVLADGRVLVVSGSGKSSVVSSVSIFNPAANTWTATANLNQPRVQPTATLLANGKVLVVGGYDDSGLVASAELYDPVKGVWTVTGSLSIARWLHTATLLPNGQVLVTGGNNASGGISTAELYNPATGVWSVTGASTQTHWMHTATLLASGNVLVAGGYTTSGGAPLTEIYTPATGQWRITKANWALNSSRVQHTATLLTNGMVLVAGGVGLGSSGYLSSAELFNPVTESWTYTGPLNAARFNPIATILANGQVMVAGGMGVGGSLYSVETYDPASGTWTLSGTLNNVGANQTATLLPSGQVLVTGSFSDPTSASAATELYNPSALPQSPATLAVNNLSQTYDGTSKAVTVVTSPAGLPVNVTYNGSTIPPVNAGSYTVVATVANPNYVGASTNTLFVGVAPITLGGVTHVNGGFQFSFSNSPGVNFTVYSATNLTGGPAAWSVLGTATEVKAGVYNFNDTQAASVPQRFYRVAAL